MSREDTTRWTLTVSKKTDIALRSLLARRGMKKGDLSAFVEDAVRRQVFDQTLQEARDRFADLPPDEAQRLIDEAMAETRQDDLAGHTAKQCE